MVKKELSQRYFNHYRNIINNPEPPPQTSAIPAQEDTSPSAHTDDSGKYDAATGQVDVSQEHIDQPAQSLSFDEDLASIAEVTPIKLNLPASQATAPEPAGTKASDKSAKKRFCFIATAAFGSPWAHEVILLQGFRDNYLSRHSLGERFIQAYYRFSPGLAKQISQHKVLKLLTRLLLIPIILMIKKGSRHPGNS